MKVIKALYDSSTNFIVDIVESFDDIALIDLIDADYHKNAKRVRGIQTNFGTKNLPLVIFEDENLVEVAAIWPENDPDWKEEIQTTLDRLINN